MIAQFPDFSELDFSHKLEVEALTSKFDPYSDFNFTSLFCWDVDDSTEISNLNNNLVIKMPDYLSGETIYSMLGRNNIDESLGQLMELAGSLKLVPQAVIENINSPQEFIITEDRDNFDYIYNLHDLAHLVGNKHKKKRNKISAFSKALAGTWVMEGSNVLNVAQKNEITEVFEKWRQESKQTDGEIKGEGAAINRLLEHSDQLNLIYITVRIEGKLVAFSINEIINDKYAYTVFEKALLVHENIYSFLLNQAATDLLYKGSIYANWAQDLGIDGLRKSKMSYHPARFLKKYSVTLS